MSEPRTFADFGIDLPSGAHGEVDCLCPQCSHTRKKSREKCLSVNVDDGTWMCHHAHCGWTGSLGGRPERRLGAAPPPRVYTRPQPMPDAPTVDADALAWFARRGIPDWVLADNKIAVGEKPVPQLDGERKRVLQFPYFRDGELVNVKYRSHPKHFFMVGGAERILYGLDGAAGQETIAIVEGEMDKLSIDAAQGPATLSVPDGAPVPDSKNYATKFSYLESAEDLFTAAKTVLIATDMDTPGERLADELARRIGPWKCKRVRWPDGCKDANETLMRDGVTGVLDALSRAAPYPVAGITSVEDLIPALELLYERGYDKGCQVGYPTLDTLYRPRAGLLNLVTGSPGSGKSFFLDNVLVRLAERHDWPIAICSPENQPLERHLAGILSVWRGLPFNDGPTPRMTLDQLRAGERWAAERFAFVLPEEPTVEAILDRAKTLVYRLGIKGLVIDPWNELDHSRPERMTEVEYISQALSKLRQFARAHKVCVWLVAHPTKLQKERDSGKYPVATPYDVSGAAHFYNKADACLSVWRDMTDPAQPTDVHVQKIRFAETGRIGVAQFRFDPPTGRFHEVGGNPL